MTPFGAHLGTLRGSKSIVFYRKTNDFLTVLPFCFKTVLGPLLGAFRGPLGGSLWLKSRLKIGQEATGPLHDYFFSLLRPPRTTFFRHGWLSRRALGALFSERKKLCKQKSAPRAPGEAPGGGIWRSFGSLLRPLGRCSSAAAFRTLAPQSSGFSLV